MIPGFDCASLKLNAITLRGVGSYLHGTRLEIAPLTLLCGTNGSGKSTWLNALQMIKSSLDQGLLPFHFDKGWSERMTNQYFKTLIDVDEDANLLSALDHPFGPPGTIGIEFEALEEINRPFSAMGLLKHSQARSVDYFGFAKTYPIGTKFRIRMANPEYSGSSVVPTQFVNFVELAIDDQPCIAYVGPIDSFSIPQTDYLPRRTKELRLLLGKGNPAIADAKLSDVELFQGLVAVASIVDPRTSGFELNEGFAGNERLLDKLNYDYEDLGLSRRFVRECNYLLKRLFQGIFPIGAIRKGESRNKIDEHDLTINSASRYVGHDAGKAWEIYLKFSSNVCRPFSQPDFSGEEFFSMGQWIFTFVSNPDDFYDVDRSPDSWDFDPSERLCGIVGVPSHFLHRTCTELLSIASKNWEDEILDLPAIRQISKLPITHDSFSPDLGHAFAAIFDYFANSLNRIANSFELTKELLGRLAEGRFAGIGVKPDFRKFHDRELDYLGNLGFDQLSRPMKREFSILLISELLWNANVDLGERFRFWRLSSVVSQWSNLICSHRLFNWYDYPFQTGRFETLRDPTFPPIPKSVRFFRKYPHLNMKSDFLEFGTPPKQRVDLGLIAHDCFGALGLNDEVLQTPQSFCSGFHQVFPIVLQTCLLSPFELVIIENPEVHLHAAAIRKTTEFLLENAKTNRLIVVETHSDLLVRRVLRAILEEDISQSAVNIYVTDLKREPIQDQGRDTGETRDKDQAMGQPIRAQFAFSTLEKLQTNDLGCVTNWPPGFLDVDTDETGLMLDALMGKRAKGGADE